ncbi:hypothetical protein G8764_12950 [Pseudomaricurvus alcaniphilus]|uniref:hypothetical protein n=1 Tax=Pseudomaricurvus alcaniphilus TaxID=1166482 RepID=UPI00140A41AB|nr:hypothetical protein [Pseudomaricurvus alcaniphilus]NHN38209.1 hypothetical protein [Pseudomaricurvus alcaniphilus]
MECPIKPKPRTCPLLATIGVALLAALLSYGVGAASPDLELGVEYQFFPQKAAAGRDNYSADQYAYASLGWDQYFADQRWLVEFDGYLGWDRHDENRQRADLRTLALSYYADRFDVKIGFATEFWGVTESRHLVDILNQTSVADNIDEEVKLGQPMLKWQTHQDWGNLQLFWLPGFRERVFAAPGARLNPALPIDASRSRYASGAEDKHQDVALRYAHTLGAWDLGLAYFRGTSREPLLDPKFNAAGELVLSPYYEQIEQTSLDLQRTGAGLLLKLEAIQRHGSRQGSYHALVSGFEFTQVGVFGSAMDLGYIAEYLYDQRGEQATTTFQNDLFLGLRLAANNIAQTSLLLGVYHDRKTSGQALRLELNTRLRDDLVLELEGQAFRNLADTDLLHGFRNDDYLRASLKFYF